MIATINAASLSHPLTASRQRENRTGQLAHNRRPAFLSLPSKKPTEVLLDANERPDVATIAVLGYN
ncbi:hypothetical protein D8I24_2473 (plasmid) [Cupriavidus necator H850]|uniref:hypothetical protein n=1 Tax=Cupriavidus necator TaxID=106590 RepID=UPI00129E342C|nr:hypothetical protein [Cupriavidus necator]KAI3605370.1 hypothetical protein D8I24_2473 [Cupriavidus necator H850]